MQGPEVLWEAGRLFDAGHLLVDVGPLYSLSAGEDKEAAGPGVRRQELAGCLVQRYFLVNPALGLPDMDEAPLKIHVLPLQPEEFVPHLMPVNNTNRMKLAA